jgi:hypothetical protein
VTKNPDYSGFDKMNRQQTCRALGPDPSGLMVSSLLGLLRDLSSGQNAYKTRTKCIQKRGCHFSNRSATGTYNFNTLKCMHFLLNSECTVQNSALRSEGQAGSPLCAPHSCKFVSIRGYTQSKIANQKSKIRIDCTYAERKLNKTE